MAFYEHPFSSYVQKAKTVVSEFAALWPIERFPHDAHSHSADFSGLRLSPHR